MKTEYEIKNELSNYKNFNNGSCDDRDFRDIFVNIGKERALEWVLEEPTYKRTIFNLTEEEINKLIGIVLPTVVKWRIQPYYEILNYKKGRLFIVGTKIFFFNQSKIKTYSIALDKNLNIAITDSTGLVAINNQIQFADTIRNMLSMEKPE